MVFTVDSANVQGWAQNDNAINRVICLFILSQCLLSTCYVQDVALFTGNTVLMDCYSRVGETQSSSSFHRKALLPKKLGSERITGRLQM